MTIIICPSKNGLHLCWRRSANSRRNISDGVGVLYAFFCVWTYVNHMHIVVRAGRLVWIYLLCRALVRNGIGLATQIEYIHTSGRAYCVHGFDFCARKTHKKPREASATRDVDDTPIVIDPPKQRPPRSATDANNQRRRRRRRACIQLCFRIWDSLLWRSICDCAWEPESKRRT